MPEAEKLLPKDARVEFIKCGFNLATNLRNVDARQTAEREERKAASKRQRLALKMDEPLYEPIEFALATTWLREQARVLYRQKTFIINGPTRCGKSQWLKMVIPGNTYCCNCKGILHPDLRDFEGPPFEDNILFDEVSPQMISEHRDLFQAPRHDISLGQSTTNCHAYKHCFFRVRMMGTSNKWTEEMVALYKASPGDHDWVEQNTMVLDVTQYMFSQKLLSSTLDLSGPV